MSVRLSTNFVLLMAMLNWGDNFKLYHKLQNDKIHCLCIDCCEKVKQDGDLKGLCFILSITDLLGNLYHHTCKNDRKKLLF